VSQGRSTARRASRPGRGDLSQTAADAARKRAALELIARHEPALKRTARRFSLDAEDADDAYQRALEIVLTKAPTTDPRDLIRWTQTVTKHEAMAVRQGREKLLGSRGPSRQGSAPDPVAQIPAPGEGPDEQAERSEAIARSREALRALKPAELRALSLLAEGYSYAEIGELTGFSHTKINRLLAEGRNRFRGLLSSSEDGSRCLELRPLLSAFCDGEAGSRDAETVREHLRACAHCRATMRAYRAAPRIAVALAPALPPSRSLLERAHDLFAGIGSRLPGASGAGAASQIAAAGGSRGAGTAALAKLLAVCAGAGGAATCVAAGVLPVPLVNHDPPAPPPVERAGEKPQQKTASEAVDHEPAPPQSPPHEAKPDRLPHEGAPGTATEAVGAPTGATEYEPPPPTPEPTPSSDGESSASSGSAAGEFGP
jgi:RNA polymerase sigma factor (sigma-70 family)